MDLDSEELEATRNKSADEMFKELGYKITEILKLEENEYFCGIQFEKEEIITKKYIEFYYYHKSIVIYSEMKINGEIKKTNSAIIDIKELQAINKKCEELGWL